MNDRDCDNCAHHSDGGCSVWECSFEQKEDDTISRQAAIDALEKWESESTWDEWCYDHKDEAEKYSVISPSSVVFGLPSALPNTQWIPCSPETMPKKTDYYLVQYTRKYCRNEMAVAFYSVEEARCDDDYTWEIETFSDIKEVIAWMPLPKPYKEGRKERTETHACDLDLQQSCNNLATDCISRQAAIDDTKARKVGRMINRDDYCKDCDRSIYGKYHDCDVNIENNGKYVMADDKCYCKIADGKRAEKYPWERREE